MKEQEPSGERSDGAMHVKPNSRIHCSVGFCVGRIEGFKDEAAVGMSDGVTDDEWLGLEVGNSVGCFDGSIVGKLVGPSL